MAETLTWRRSQHCDNSACVEVARTDAGMALRDSTRPEGPMLRFGGTEWARFVAYLHTTQRRIC